MSTPALRFQDRDLQPLPQETVLDALLRCGISTPFSCKGGVCHTCMLQCTDGAIPAGAQRGLKDTLQAKGYFLPCKCVATGPMQLRPPQPQDMVTRCMLVEVQGHAEGLLRIQFEALGHFPCKAGQTARLVTDRQPEPLLLLVSPPDAPVIEAHWTLQAGETVPEALAPGAEFGLEFELRGPFNADQGERAPLPPPPTDPALWQALAGGRLVRAVLEDFYARVFADSLLAPFFVGRITQDYIVGKQYAFLEQAITGARVYWGDTPRNTHHWMVIPHSLFDHRQRLLEEVQRAHGLAPALRQRWNFYEEYYRPDLVKDQEWPRRRFDGQLDRLDGFEELEIDCGTVCDACGAEVPAGTRVTSHRRTGRISCPGCSAQPA